LDATIVFLEQRGNRIDLLVRFTKYRQQYCAATRRCRLGLLKKHERDTEEIDCNNGKEKEKNKKSQKWNHKALPPRPVQKS